MLFVSGFFVFHYGSSIGTHQIEIRQEEKGETIFPVVVIWKGQNYKLVF